MTIGGLHDALDRVESDRKSLDVYAAETDVAAEFERQFATRNVTVNYHRVAAFDDGFVVVRDDDRFRGTLGLDHFDALLSPEIHPPWALEETDGETREMFDFLDRTVFTAYDRHQLLATTREIEERAWRVGEGQLYAGFQRRGALAEQLDVYGHLASHGTLTVTALVDDPWDEPTDDLTVVANADGEIGDFWFVVFDSGERDRQKCALLANQRQSERYRGFWTYDSGLVDDLVDYLERTYDLPNA